VRVGAAYPARRRVELIHVAHKVDRSRGRSCTRAGGSISYHSWWDSDISSYSAGCIPPDSERSAGVPIADPLTARLSRS
jgi:hypothetical protein